MKREIKFRAWDKKGKEMWGISSIHFGPEDEILWLDLDKVKAYPLENVKPEQVELMQFTGLKDKNGKEIYEGDIIWDEAWGYSEQTGLKRIGQIVWKYAKFYVEGYGPREYRFGERTKNSFEVIGNIYQNPELLI